MQPIGMCSEEDLRLKSAGNCLELNPVVKVDGQVSKGAEGGLILLACQLHENLRDFEGIFHSIWIPGFTWPK